LFVCLLLQSFTNLIEEKRLRAQLLNENCFVCGLTKTVIEENADFNHHIDTEHSPGHYVYFIWHISKLAHENASLVEKEVSRSLKTHNFDWVPLKRALFVKKKDSAE